MTERVKLALLYVSGCVAAVVGAYVLCRERPDIATLAGWTLLAASVCGLSGFTALLAVFRWAGRQPSDGSRSRAGTSAWFAGLVLKNAAAIITGAFSLGVVGVAAFLYPELAKRVDQEQQAEADRRKYAREIFASLSSFRAALTAFGSSCHPQVSGMLRPAPLRDAYASPPPLDARCRELYERSVDGWVHASWLLLPFIRETVDASSCKSAATSILNERCVSQRSDSDELDVKEDPPKGMDEGTWIACRTLKDPKVGECSNSAYRRFVNAYAAYTKRRRAADWTAIGTAAEALYIETRFLGCALRLAADASDGSAREPTKASYRCRCVLLRNAGCEEDPLLEWSDWSRPDALL